MLNAVEVLSAIMENPTDLKHVASLVTDDVTYVSLNHSNPDLHKIMPWCGTSSGAEGIVQTFIDVDRYWEKLAFETEALFGDDENAALFGKFTYRSRVLSQVVNSPFAVWARVKNGQCNYLMFMEDTFATGQSFKSGGAWSFQSNPNGEKVVI